MNESPYPIEEKLCFLSLKLKAFHYFYNLIFL